MQSDDVLFSDYVYKRKPVIITNLFQGSEIREIQTMDDARRAFSSVALQVQGEYSAAASGHNSNASRTMLFNEYWDAVKANPQAKLVVTENDIPARLLALFDLPSVCRAQDFGVPEILGMPKKSGDHDIYGSLFLAGEGNKAHLHYDGDHRHVLLYQVFGRKRVTLFHPESTYALKPLDAPFAGSSGLFLDRMSEDERQDLLHRANGFCDILNPGEAVYIPMLMWHHLDYVDDGMSFNLRFGRNRYGRFLCVDNFHRDHYIQVFGSHLAGPPQGRSPYTDAIPAIAQEYVRESGDRERIMSMRRMFKGLCETLCDGARTHEYYTAENEAAVVENIIRDIGASKRYLHPSLVSSVRPSGPSSLTQRQQVQQKITKCGYSKSVLTRVLQNKFAKPDVQALSKAEAAQFLGYLRTPAAAW